jgi:hypothetical protein
MKKHGYGGEDSSEGARWPRTATTPHLYDTTNSSATLINKPPHGAYLDMLCLSNASDPNIISWGPDWTSVDAALSYHPEQFESLDLFYKFQLFTPMSIGQKTTPVRGSGTYLSWLHNYMRFLRLEYLAQHAKWPYGIAIDKPFRRYREPSNGSFAVGKAASKAVFSPDGKELTCSTSYCPRYCQTTMAQ